MRRAIIMMAVPAGIVLATLALYADGNSDAPVPVFKPEAPLQDLMELNEELNDGLRSHLGSEPDFKAAAHQAKLIAEISNVVRYHQPPDVSDWWRFADAFRDGARKVVAAAEAKDLEKSRTELRAMVATCKQCHDVYRKE